MTQSNGAQGDSDLPAVEDQSIEETPPAAGGQDDSAPEQGEGRQDSH